MNALSVSNQLAAVATEPTEPTKPASREFAKQLEKLKPVVKKPTLELPAPELAAQAAAPAEPSIVQILVALLHGATVQPQVVATTAPQVPAGTADVATAQAAAVPAQVADAVKDQIVKQLVAVAPEAAETPRLTPLEQAVHDLLGELADKQASHAGGDRSSAFTLQLAPPIVLAPIDHDVAPLAQAAPVQPQQPAELVSQNHAHLVFDDANGRVVMTVAIRGTDVNVSMRASDDTTAAALARNAGSLDEAMRGRGLQLAQFDSQRDLAREENREKPTYRRNREHDRSNKFHQLVDELGGGADATKRQ